MNIKSLINKCYYDFRDCREIQSHTRLAISQLHGSQLKAFIKHMDTNGPLTWTQMHKRNTKLNKRRKRNSFF